MSVSGLVLVSGHLTTSCGSTEESCAWTMIAVSTFVHVGTAVFETYAFTASVKTRLQITILPLHIG